MKLRNELLSILENKNESFGNRLKLADTIIRIPEKLLEDEESIIIRWLLNEINHESPESWEILLSWLTSEKLNCVFNANSITLNLLIQAILINIQKVNSHLKETLISISLLILENNVPQSFIKSNISDYCCFLFTVINEIDNPLSLAKFLDKDILYNKNVVTNNTFILYFVNSGISILTKVRKKFCGNQNVCRSISTFIEKGIFQHSKKAFDLYYSKLFEDKKCSEEIFFPKLLLNQLKTAVSTNRIDTQIMFEIIFESYNYCYQNDFGSIYKFIILILDMLGFSQKILLEVKLNDSQNLNLNCTEALDIIASIFRILTSNNIDLNCKVKEVTFESFLEDFIVSLVAAVRHPTEDVYDIFLHLSSIAPLSIERKLDILLPYFLLTTKHNEKYPQLLNIFMDIFAKLHRLQSFVSKMVKLMKAHLCNHNDTHDIYNIETLNIDSMFPKLVQDNFTNSLAALASWQVMNIFKTLIFHLNEVHDDLQTLADDFRYVLYVEIISMLTCLLLSTTRIAEHTISETIVDNFICGMKELQDIIKSFGISLVKREHNPRLMYAYLNICYNWADLSILMKCHLNRRNMHFNLTLDSDNTGYNITSIHPYLTRDQWCLIAERITNFGEAPCKKIMHKLLVQKLKALFIFEKEFYEEVETSVIRIINKNIDSTWEDLLCDNFALKHIGPRLDKTSLLQLSEIIFKQFHKSDNIFLKRNAEISNCEALISAILYTNLSKISGLFKGKRKHGESAVKQMRTYTFFCNIPCDIILSNGNTTADEFDVVLSNFITTANLKDTDTKDDFNEKKIYEYLEIFGKLPVLFLSQEVETALFLYFIIILLDLKLLQSAVSENCERIIIGFLKNEKILFDRIPNMDFILQTILKCFNNYEEAFALLCINILTKYNGSNLLEVKKEYKLVEGIKNFLLPNIREPKYLQLAIVTIKQINKFKKLKISQEGKNEIYTLQLQMLLGCAKLLEEVDLFSQPHFIECYNLVLKHALDKEDETILPQLILKLEDCLNNICVARERANVQECVKLFITIFHYKNKINVDTSIATKTWDFCKSIDIHESEWEEYSKLIILLFEHMSNEEFSEASHELLQIIDCRVGRRAGEAGDDKQMLKWQLHK
ncbi:uncharacterized protein LOC108735919 isoform X4 [Agrilus planipennis]|uniref:Uncharacterized protein LOC108735919 isoform X4 n=1 Tax=Agrilus planipennis TaxID=224129 RepID=A0A7F5QVS6_AGRPL|nr:uncharacterized protein LOC108735919 isoform X4 [Agrilus planipennis]